jgi:DNA repair protein SbcD/Mre11
MKILHTSDWHLGRSLYGQKRYDEFTAFLDWLGTTIEKQAVDALLVAGDVFDTSTPGNRAQQLYYRFLNRVSGSCCRHVVIIAGNHDSPSFLDAPGELLKALNVHVVGAACQDPADEVVVLTDDRHQPSAIVCAVPYLRDRDIRTVEPGETIDEKNARLIEGLKTHYAAVCAVAEKKQAEWEKNGHSHVPIVAMGHLFTAGGKTVEGDGVRDLYVGSLAHVGREVFPASIDYLALGHLHMAQRVGGVAHIRYCGSPIPMGFGEAAREKKVIIIEFNNSTPEIGELPVPCFQPLERIAGSLGDIVAKMEQLKEDHSRAWLEIEYTGNDLVSNLREIMDEALAGSAMEIRRIKNKPMIDRVINRIHDDETLDDLDVHDVFNRCPDTFEVPAEDRADLIRSYDEIIHTLVTADPQAE